MKRLRPTYVYLTIVLAGFLVMAPRAAQAQNKWTHLQARHSKRCLDVRAKSKADRGTVQQYNCTPKAANQLWQLVPASGGSYYMVNRNSGKCLDVRSASTKKGAWLQQYTCKGGANQQFKLQSTKRKGWYQIVAQHSGMCLDVKSASTGDRARIQQFPCKPDRNNNQLWRLHQPK